ncbi:MAG TPA: type II toxin-antitoxin system RelE/ParE family toxin [Chthoniobacter sp.]|nr:type II toxin-antitoxin system RelE/ParE family toxin [Chthoniobacter sp.]
MMEVVWTLGVDLDLQSIYQRLEVQSSGSGDRFFEALLEKIGQLQVFPQIGPVVHRGFIRRVLVFGRHYGLFYSIESRGIILHALEDLRGAPERIAQRLRQI